MGRYDGKVVLISGIGAGMGRQAAKRFAEEGAKVVGCDLNAEKLDGVVAEVRAAIRFFCHSPVFRRFGLQE